MARFVKTERGEGKQIVTVYEEGKKKKEIKRENQDGHFSLGVMHKNEKGYEYGKI